MSELVAGRFQLLRALGSGGMGEVSLALDRTTGAECALKRLRADKATSETLRQEFAALIAVRHPAIVSVYEFGVDFDGTPFFTMEYVPGLPADRALAPGRWAPIAHVAARVLAGLEALHRGGVVHGDLKPSNILIVPSGAAGAIPSGVRLVDFGLAALPGAVGDGHRGTPGFAAPEVVRGAAPTPASDLYGLGATLYALMSGRAPFEAGDPSSLLRRQQSGPPPALPLEEANAPEALQRFVLGLMAPAPAERPRDARTARLDLERAWPATREPLERRLASVTLVGRERELARIEALRLGARRRARALFLYGEAGAGKSALLEAFAGRASLAGSSVASLSCAALEGPAALALALARRFAADAQVSAEEWPAEVRPLLERDAATLVERDIEMLVETMIGWGKAAAGRAEPLVLLLDDAEAADDLSRSVLRRVMLHPSAPATRWVWARRSSAAEAPEDERLLIASGRAEALELGTLAREAVARLVSERLGEPGPPALVERVWEMSGGHAGLVVQLLLTAARDGALFEGESGLAVNGEALKALRPPRGFEEALLDRFAALDAAPRAAMLALAIYGRAASASELAALDGRVSEAVLDALLGSGLARRASDARFQLVPPALAIRLLERLSAEEREALHRAAMAIGSLPPRETFVHARAAGDRERALAAAETAWQADSDPEIAAEVAAYLAPIEPRQAAAWYERAAEVLRARGLYARAIACLEPAVKLDDRPEERARRTAFLVTSHLRCGNFAQAESLATRALQEPVPDEWRVRLVTDRAHTLMSRARGASRAEIITMLEGAVELGKQVGNAKNLIGAYLTLATAYLDGGRAEEAAIAAGAVREIAVQTNDVSGVVRAMLMESNVDLQAGRLEAADTLQRDAISKAREFSLRLELQQAFGARPAVTSALGNWVEARATAAESLRIQLEDERVEDAGIALANAAVLDALTGHPRTALRRAARAVRMCREFSPRNEGFAVNVVAQCLRLSGDRRRALRAARRAAALEASGRTGSPWVRIEYGRCCAAHGRWAEALSAWEEGIRAGGEHASVTVTLMRALAGRASLQLGSATGASTRLAEIEAWLAHNPAPYVRAHALQLSAELKLAGRDASEAVDVIQECLAAYSALPAPPERAAAQLGFARRALRSAASARLPVGTWLEDAAGVFARIGDRHQLAQALALHVEWLKATRAEHAPGASPLGLIAAVSRLLNSLSDFRELTRRAMQLAVEQLEAERGVLLLADPEDGRLAPVAEFGAIDASTRGDAVRYSRRVVQRVAESGGSLLITDAPADPQARSESVVDLRLRSIVCVPLHLGGRVVGAVYLDDSRRAGVFDDADRGLLEGFAHLMAIAIEKSRGHQEVERTNERLIGENLSLRQEASVRFQPQNLVGNSSPMQRVLSLVELASRVNTTVLITGESGTGKELIARTLHHSGKRRHRPFVTINCGAIPETLLESELFGILPDIATGVRGRDGRFVQAEGGTLFLDEVGEMPSKQQVALLSAIANREITPVGGGKPIPVDVRIIAATNQDLRKLVEGERFREDLYYRLNVFPIELPPLRERKADIPAIAQHFVAVFSKQLEREIPVLSPEFLGAIMQSDWPGNVRELQNYTERVLAMNPGRVLHPTPLPRDLEDRASAVRWPGASKLADMVAELEKKTILDALQKANGNQSLAARQLHMTEQSLRYKLRKYGLDSTRTNLRARHNQRTSL